MNKSLGIQSLAWKVYNDRTYSARIIKLSLPHLVKSTPGKVLNVREEGDYRNWTSANKGGCGEQILVILW